jgi:hypothetical protein
MYSNFALAILKQLLYWKTVNFAAVVTVWTDGTQPCGSAIRVRSSLSHEHPTNHAGDTTK